MCNRLAYHSINIVVIYKKEFLHGPLPLINRNILQSFYLMVLWYCKNEAAPQKMLHYIRNCTTEFMNYCNLGLFTYIHAYVHPFSCVIIEQAYIRTSHTVRTSSKPPS